MAQLIRIYFHGLFLSRVRSITQTYGVSQIWDRRETGCHHSAAARAGYEAARPGLKKPLQTASPPHRILALFFPGPRRVCSPRVSHMKRAFARNYLTAHYLAACMPGPCTRTDRHTTHTHEHNSCGGCDLQASCMAPVVKANILGGEMEATVEVWSTGGGCSGGGSSGQRRRRKARAGATKDGLHVLKHASLSLPLTPHPLPLSSPPSLSEMQRRKKKNLACKLFNFGVLF